MGGQEGFDRASSKGPRPWSPITAEKALASTTSIRVTGRARWTSWSQSGPGRRAPLSTTSQTSLPARAPAATAEAECRPTSTEPGPAALAATTHTYAPALLLCSCTSLRRRSAAMTTEDGSGTATAAPLGRASPSRREVGSLASSSAATQIPSTGSGADNARAESHQAAPADGKYSMRRRHAWSRLAGFSPARSARTAAASWAGNSSPLSHPLAR